MAPPDYFCWTRFGAEAGQAISDIFERKEQERRANNGIFFWGIGNAIGPSIEELLKRTEFPEVLFSPIKSPASHPDVQPAAVATWASAQTLTGEQFLLPRCSMVTSRYNPSLPKKSHYALVCFSDDSLNCCDCDDTISFATLRNLKTGRPIGASQVTAVVQQSRAMSHGVSTYKVAIRAKLVFPYFLRLTNPQPLLRQIATGDWASAVRQMWDQRRNFAV